MRTSFGRKRCKYNVPSGKAAFLISCNTLKFRQGTQRYYFVSTSMPFWGGLLLFLSLNYYFNLRGSQLTGSQTNYTYYVEVYILKLIPCTEHRKILHRCGRCHSGQLEFSHHFNTLSSFTEDMKRPTVHTPKFCILLSFLSAVTLHHLKQWNV